MKKKLMIFIGIFFVFLFNLSLLSQAEENEKNIVYIYSLTNQLSESVLTEFKDKGINISSIDVTNLDNMKYYYLYNEAYNIGEEDQKLPIVISGDAYFSGEKYIEASLQDIEQNASNPIKDISNIDIKMIIYFHSPTKQLLESTMTELKDKGIKINSIDVTNLDNMKYFYLYNTAYNIEEEDQKLPIVISGDAYYSGDEYIQTSLQDIEQNASKPFKDIDNVKINMIVYFYSQSCTECQATKPSITVLENRGIKVIEVDVSTTDNEGNYINRTLFNSYGNSYNIPKVTVPMVISGDQYYHSKETITSSLDEIEANSSKPLLHVELVDVDLEKYEGFWGLLLILFAGLVDGVNPCAMAMLILFVSLLVGLSSKKSTLISVSIAYILGLFVTYFSLGAFLIHIFDKIGPYLQNLSFYINIFIIALSLFLFLFNLHDYFVSKNEEYGKIKNQLPKGIQKFNKKLIKIFTKSLNNKNIIVVYIISFILGVVISLTEFLCTGQVYLPTILIIAQTGGLSGTIKLFLYNIMFILPLIAIAVVAIKAQSTMETSNKIREKMHLIKLITSILFLVIAIYYILKVLGVM